MIASFRHKGLSEFYNTGSKAGIQPAHAKKLQRILTLLNVATKSEDINVPGFNLHKLEGDLADFWSVWVNGNWRVTFKFKGDDVELVDYLDYH